MKKYSVLILSVLLTTSLIAGCAQKTENTEVVEETAEVISVEETATEAMEVEKVSVDAEKEIQTEEAESEQADIFIEEQILLDENSIKMTATGIERTATGDCYLNLQMENNTDQDLAFVMDEPFVNTCYTGNAYREEVKAGESKKGSYLFLSNDFYKLYDAGDPAEIKVYAEVNTADGMENIVSRRVITIQTNKIEEFNGAYDDSGEIIYENNGIKVINKGVNADNTAVIICVENQNHGSMCIMAEDIVINGYALRGTFLCANESGQKQIGLIYFKDAEWNDVEIGTLTEGEMTLQIMLNESGTYMDYVPEASEHVSLTF